MRRREFIVFVGGAAVTWPLSGITQQVERIRRIGMLMTIAADDPEAQARLATFRTHLEELGWSERRNVQIDSRFGGAMRTASGNPRRNWSHSRRMSF